MKCARWCRVKCWDWSWSTEHFLGLLLYFALDTQLDNVCVPKSYSKICLAEGVMLTEEFVKATCIVAFLGYQVDFKALAEWP